jgi:hypothetical protein
MVDRASFLGPSAVRRGRSSFGRARSKADKLVLRTVSAHGARSRWSSSWSVPPRRTVTNRGIPDLGEDHQSADDPEEVRRVVATLDRYEALELRRAVDGEGLPLRLGVLVAQEVDVLAGPGTAAEPGEALLEVKSVCRGPGSWVSEGGREPRSRAPGLS